MGESRMAIIILTHSQLPTQNIRQVHFLSAERTIISASAVTRCQELSCRNDQALLFKKGLVWYWPEQLLWGAGIAQRLERRSRDGKVAGSNPGRRGRWNFFSGVNFLCWLLFWYPFLPSVTAVARKRSRSFRQKCRWQVTAVHACILRKRSEFGYTRE